MPEFGDHVPGLKEAVDAINTSLAGKLATGSALLRAANDFSIGISQKAAPVNADIVLIEDSEDSFNKKWAELGSLPGGGGGGGAPTTADYLVKTANAGLSAERVVTDTSTIAWDWATAGQAKAEIPAAAVVFAKIQNIATDSLIGRDAAGSGPPESILLNSTLEFDGAGNIRRAAITGDVSIPAGSNASTISGLDAAKISAGSVSNAEFDRLDGVTSGIQSQLDAKQPLDADLTAIAALSTSAYGRSLLEAANASALQTLIASWIHGNFALNDNANDHKMTMRVAEDLTLDRILNIVLNNATRTLTIAGDATISNTNSGDVTLAGETYISIAAQVITAAKITEAQQNLADNTTADVSTTKHGYAPKAPNDATKFLDGTGAWDTVKDSDLSTSDITTNDVSTTKHGFVPKAPNDTTKFLRGDASWAAASDPGGWTTIVKSANQDVTNAGLTNDSEFAFSVVAGGHYSVDMDLILSANNATADYTMDFTVSAGTMKGKGTCQNLTSADAIQNIIVIASAAASTTAIVTGCVADLDTLIAVNVKYAFTASNSTTLTFRFGNAAAGGGRTSRTWKGSILRWKRLD